jgi:hypothetical protein
MTNGFLQYLLSPNKIIAMINTYIYYLHAGDFIPRYVGKSNNPKERLYQHNSLTERKNYQMEVLDEVPMDEFKFWERWYVELFESWGFVLENKSKAGAGPGIRPNTWGDKISKALKGKQPNWSEEEIKARKTRLKGKQFALGYKYTKEQKQKMTEGRKKNILQYDLEGNFIKEWYATFTEIANYYNKDVSNITHHLHNRQASAYGYVWKLESLTK